MANADITLTNANVNSGTAVVVLGGNVTYTWKNLTKVTPVDGKYDITESHYGGFENPKVVITGDIDADNKDELTNVMTFVMLINFASERSEVTKLKISAGIKPTVIGGRPTNGYVTTGSNSLDTTNGLDIQIETFTISFSSSRSLSGQRMSYTITAHETA